MLANISSSLIQVSSSGSSSPVFSKNSCDDTDLIQLRITITNFRKRNFLFNVMVELSYIIQVFLFLMPYG